MGLAEAEGAFSSIRVARRAAAYRAGRCRRCGTTLVTLLLSWLCLSSLLRLWTPKPPKATLLLMGGVPHRLPNWEVLLSTYGRMPHLLDAIVVVWCPIQGTTAPPAIPSELPVRVEIVIAPNASLNQRYDIADRYIHTDSVLVADDDLIVPPTLLARLLHSLHGAPEAIVGLDGRCLVPGDANETAYRDDYLACRLLHPDAVLTKTMAFHRRALTLYREQT